MDWQYELCTKRRSSAATSGIFTFLDSLAASTILSGYTPIDPPRVVMHHHRSEDHVTFIESLGAALCSVPDGEPNFVGPL
jgi:hypothetical protein